MTEEEDRIVVNTVVRIANGRVPVIAGSGSNSTDMAIKYTKMAEEEGADGSLQVAPYYNKPTQEGLYRHFATIAESTDLPHHPLQYPRTDGRHDLSRDNSPPRRSAQHHRGQGVDALHEHGERHKEPLWRRVRHPLRGRSDDAPSHGPGRARCDLRGLQRRPGVVSDMVRALLEGTGRGAASSTTSCCRSSALSSSRPTPFPSRRQLRSSACARTRCGCR